MSNLNVSLLEELGVTIIHPDPMNVITAAKRRKLEENKIKISFKNVYQQKFNFPSDAMKHVLVTANFKVAKKLYFTCKYFPAKYRLFLVDKIDNYDNIIFNNSKNEAYSIEKFDEKIWLGSDDLTRDCGSRWIPMIKKCALKKLDFQFMGLLWDEFKILAKDGLIEELGIEGIKNPDGKSIALEDICALVPKVKDLRLENTHVTPNSMKEICASHNPAVKITRFFLKKVDSPLNAFDYLEFLREHGYQHSSTTFCVSYCPESAIKEKKEFISTIKAEIEKWPNPKPYFIGCCVTSYNTGMTYPDIIQLPRLPEIPTWSNQGISNSAIRQDYLMGSANWTPGNFQISEQKDIFDRKDEIGSLDGYNTGQNSSSFFYTNGPSFNFTK